MYDNEVLNRLHQHYLAHPVLESRPLVVRGFLDDEPMLAADFRVGVNHLTSTLYFQQMMLEFLEQLQLFQMQYDQWWHYHRAVAGVADVLRLLANTALTALRYFSNTNNCSLDALALFAVLRSVFDTEHSCCTYSRAFYSDYMTNVITRCCHALRPLGPPEVLNTMFVLYGTLGWQLCGPLAPSFCDQLQLLLTKLVQQFPEQLGFVGGDRFQSSVQMLALFVVVAQPELLQRRSQSFVALALLLFVLENSWSPGNNHTNAAFGINFLVYLQQKLTDEQRQWTAVLADRLLDRLWTYARAHMVHAEHQMADLSTIFYDRYSIRRPSRLVLRSPGTINFMSMCRLTLKCRMFLKHVPSSPVSLLASQ